MPSGSMYQQCLQNPALSSLIITIGCALMPHARVLPNIIFNFHNIITNDEYAM